MSKYLKKFETEAQYTAAESGLILPNVSLVTENNAVHYSPSSPTPSHDYVDLGLPSGTLWATMNIGASSETDYGNYYQYGKGADQYAATSGDSNYDGTENPLSASVDTAVQVWGGSWHMPTSAQYNELKNNTDYSFTTINGVSGGKFTSKTDSSKYIFLPAGGWYDNGSLKQDGSCCYCWSSTPDDNLAYCFLVSEMMYGVTQSSRNSGYPIRPVVG